MTDRRTSRGVKRPSGIKFVGDVRRLRLRPGDIVVLTTPGHLSLEQCELLKAALAAQIPNHKILVVGDGLKLGVLSPVESA